MARIKVDSEKPFPFTLWSYSGPTCSQDFNTTSRPFPILWEQRKQKDIILFPVEKRLQERRLAPNQIILLRWYDLSYTLFKASYLHNLTAVLFSPSLHRQLLAMHESQVKCIPFNSRAPRRQKYNYVLQVDSYLWPPSFPRRLSVCILRAFLEYFTVCQVAVPPCKCAIVSLKRSLLSISAREGEENVV